MITQNSISSKSISEEWKLGYFQINEKKHLSLLECVGSPPALYEMLEVI